MAEDIPEPIRRFVVANIASIAQLEALLLLSADPAQSLSSEQLARKLYCDPVMIARQLAALESAGLLKTNSDSAVSYSYQPATEELAQMVAQLAAIYRDRRVALTTLIYSDATYALRTFADSFRIRKDKGNK